VTEPAEQLDQLRKVCPDAELVQEGGRTAVLLRGIQIATPHGRERRDALLWPWSRDNYESRLFLSEAVSAPNAKNWNPFTILGRTWYACSWQGVSSALPWLEILGGHLRAFR
jgi:hypothetical protein